MPTLPPKSTLKPHQRAVQDRVSQFHASRIWKKVRNAYRADQPVCERCTFYNDLHHKSCNGLSVHHIEMIAHNWALRCDFNNLLTLCADCHSIYTAMERSGQVDRAIEHGREVKDRT